MLITHNIKCAQPWQVLQVYGPIMTALHGVYSVLTFLVLLLFIRWRKPNNPCGNFFWCWRRPWYCRKEWSREGLERRSNCNQRCNKRKSQAHNCAVYWRGSNPEMVLTNHECHAARLFALLVDLLSLTARDKVIQPSNNTCCTCMYSVLVHVDYVTGKLHVQWSIYNEKSN